ncbi:MAG: TonB C-terminal domain-containing protein [Elusimicrobia bacterium]|nr:TonB C-terminal domain-containing protein [Elusimicrobiota bacterium]
MGGVGTSLEIGGFGPGGGGDASKQFPFKWYGELIYKRLWEAWDRTDAGTRECKVGFVVQRDGSVKSVKIKASSGDSLFDMTAKRAVTAAAPFPPLPDGFKEKELPVLVRFRLQ